MSSLVFRTTTGNTLEREIPKNRDSTSSPKASGNTQIASTAKPIITAMTTRPIEARIRPAR